MFEMISIVIVNWNTGFQLSECINSIVNYHSDLVESVIIVGNAFTDSSLQKFRFKFRVIGGGSIDLPGVDVEFVPWSEATAVASIQVCDIGVMPLTDSDWERGKCGYKLIQYMACGLPVVASAVGAN